MKSLHTRSLINRSGICLLLLCLCLIKGNHIQAQITGPATVCPNVEVSYTPGSIYSNSYIWHITGGTIVRAARTVFVKWNAGGGTLSLEYYDRDLGDYIYASSKQVKAYSGGVVGGPANICRSTPFTVTVSNNIGPVDHWEYSQDGSYWMAVPGTNTTSYNLSGIIFTTSFRAVVNGPSCTLYSTPFTVNALGTDPMMPGVTNATSCTPASLTLYANGSGITTYKWYADDGTLLKSGPDNYFVTPVLSATTTYYVSCIRGLGCESYRTPVTATIDVVPAPLAPALVEQCGSSTLAALAPPQGYTHYWQTVYNGTSTANAGLTYTPPTTNKEYYLRTRNNSTGCWSSGVGIYVRDNSIPAAPAQPVVSQTCGIATLRTITPHPNDGVAYYWQTSAAGTSTANGGLTWQPAGSGTYYLRAKRMNVNFECWSPAISIAVAVQPQSCLEGQNRNYIVSNTIQKAGVYYDYEIPELVLNDLGQVVSYADGFGRTIQNVIPLGSPGRQDIVQIVSYDRFGRQPRQYLPYVAGNDGKYKNTANALTAFYATTGPDNDRAATSTPWAETVFEASILNKIIEQGAPGESWQIGTGHTTGTVTRPCTAGEVRNWAYDFSTGQCTTADYYAAGELLVTETTNAEGVKEWQYVNKQGKLVLLKKERSAGVFAETYYIYDAFSRLRMVIQPEGTKLLLASGNFTLTADIINKWCFTFKFDKLGRVTEKKAPGAAVVYFVYNKRYQPVLVQDGNQRRRIQWSFTKYNALGKPVITGLYTHNTAASQEQMQQAADLQDGQFEERTATSFNLQYGYTIDRSFPVLNSTNSTINTVTYYDDYNFDNDAAGIPDVSYQTAGLNPEAAPDGEVKGIATGTRVRVLGSNNMLLTAMFYDRWNQLIQEQEQNHLGGQDVVTHLYDFMGKKLETRRRHQVDATPLTVTKQFTYDHAGRLLQVKQQNNNDAPVTLSAYRYNELGQYVEKKQHSTDGANYLHKLNYRYNIRGWLSKINDAGLSRATDLFGMELRYNEGSVSRPGAAYYDGKIAEIIYNDRRDNQPKAYVFNYDKLNRLTGARYTERSTTGWNARIDELNEDGISYDLNGNINTLARYAPLQSGTGREQWDSLTYTYSGNQLIKVEDGGSATNGFVNGVNEAVEYTYDDNGNLVADNNKGIHIHYNYLNLVDTVFVNAGGSIAYTYNADGTRLSKTVTNATSNTTARHYVKNFEYNQNRQLEFFPTEEGRVVKQGTGFSYEYNITDHLGNVRVSFDKDPATSQARIIQKNSYYPFGGVQPGGYTSGLANKYLYNGKELQNELGINLYDFGARMQDPLLGRFFTPDRFAEKYLHLSPYQFTNNNPMNVVDVNGDSLWIIQDGSKPRILYQNGRLLNQDGSEYTGEITGFAKKAFDALLELASGRDGKAMLDKLEASTENIKIAETGNRSEYTPYDRTARWNSQQKDGGFDVNGNQDRQGFIGLGHELAHSLDHINGTLDYSPVEGFPFKKGEHFATYMENKFRAEHGLPLRKFYGKVKSPNGDYGAYPLLNDDNRTSMHHDAGYDFIKNAVPVQKDFESRLLQRNNLVPACYILNGKPQVLP